VINQPGFNYEIVELNVGNYCGGEAKMEYRMRRYESEEDYCMLREFLRKVFRANGLREYSWHVMENCLKVYSLNEHIIFWEDGNKKIVAAVN
jgi:hypothetical protein